MHNPVLSNWGAGKEMPRAFGEFMLENLYSIGNIRSMGKAHILEELYAKQFQFFIVPKLMYFTVGEWHVDRLNIINKISNQFKKPIIVRSSALSEDGQKN